MIAIVIPIESEGSSFFNRRYAIVSLIPAGQLLTKNHQNIGMNLLNKKNARIKRNSWEEDKKAIYGHGQICTF